MRYFSFLKKEKAMDFNEMCEIALAVCKEGKACMELKELYKSPWRERVNWALFPDWARPDFVFEAEHEG